jgi:hypothetical protein
VKPVIVDTSVWRKFFAGVPAFKSLGSLLDEDGAVLIHPFVVGELVMGGLSSREEALFRRLPPAAMLAHEEVLDLVRRRRLSRRGIGWIDAHLLGSTLVSTASLWTADRDLSSAAAALRLSFAGSAT